MWGSNALGDQLLLVLHSKWKSVPILCLSACCIRQAGTSATQRQDSGKHSAPACPAHLCPQGICCKAYPTCRLVAGAYDENGDKQLGTGCSAPIRVLANNDVPTGAACIKLHLSLE